MISTTADLALEILIALGGNMSEVGNRYLSTTNDILAAVKARVAKSVITLPLGTTNYDLPQNSFLDDVVFVGQEFEQFDFSIGITPAGSEIVNNDTVYLGKAVCPVKYYCEMARTIYFKDVPEEVTIKLYIK